MAATHTLPYEAAYPEKVEKDGEVYFKLETSPLDFISDEHEYGVLIIQRGRKTQDTYAKRVFEGSVNFLVEATTQSLLSKNKKDYKDNLNEQGINIEFVHMLNRLGMFAGYFINSTSWETQQLQDFDKDELKKRLETVLRYFK